MSNSISTTAHTLFGFDKLAKAHHLGTSGIKTGSGGGKQAGSTHLFNKATGRTACGKARGQMSTFSVPVEITEANWDVRIGLCRTCRKHARV
jgi:hypothetical protein